MSIKKSSRKALNKYVREIANLLGLRDWTLVINYDKASVADESSRIDIIYGRRVATLYWGPTFWQESRSDQRNTVVHELIHIHLDPIAAVARDMKEQLGEMVYGPFSSNHHRQIELATDAIATAISSHYPLPPPMS